MLKVCPATTVVPAQAETQNRQPDGFFRTILGSRLRGNDGVWGAARGGLCRARHHGIRFLVGP